MKDGGGGCGEKSWSVYILPIVYNICMYDVYTYDIIAHRGGEITSGRLYGKKTKGDRGTRFY